MENRANIEILGVNVIYFVTAILLLTIGSFVQEKDIITGLIITEYVLVLLPSIIYLKFKKNNLTKSLRLNKLRLKHGFLIIVITIFCYPVALFCNLIVLTLLSILGKIQQPPIPTANNLKEFAILMVIIAISAGICEEVFFRGMIMREYERFGQTNAIVFSALLFGLFHFNLQNFAGPTVLGLIFGYFVYRTNSLFAGILGHITNNGIAVTIGFLANLANQKLIQQDIPPIQQIPSTLQMIASTISIGIIATITGGIAFVLLRIFIRETENGVDRTEQGKSLYNRPSIFIFIPVFLTIALFIYVAYIQIIQMI